MNYATKPDQSSHWLLRVLYAIAAGICLLFGVIGLVLPIIPGIVFLAIGAMLLGKVSSRFAHFPYGAGPDRVIVTCRPAPHCPSPTGCVSAAGLSPAA